LCITWVLFQLLQQATGMPMILNLERIGFILFLTVLMCAGSGLLAVRKAQEADPAEVF
jgi:putative ABC transport system permease protein